MEEIKPFLNLLADPINLTILALISLGYIIQYTEFINNRWIPGILCVFSVAITPAMLVIVQKMGYSHAIVEGILRGVVYATIAWLLHNRVLNKYLDPKLPEAIQPKENYEKKDL